MTTQQVADRYNELAQERKWLALQEELYAEDAVCREPEKAAAVGLPIITEGLEAIKAKGIARRASIETIHDDFSSVPLVGGSHFSVSFMRDLTMKGKPRVKLEEIGVFHVKDGKIVLEQFFY
jgi:hypothetical protein